MNYEAHHYAVLSTFLSLHPFMSKHSAKHLYPDVRHFKFIVCPSFNMRDQVSHTTGNTILLYILILMFVDSSLECKRL
jgi:hypothetical protein